jgi:osmotically-inducible protein OsmY
MTMRFLPIFLIIAFVCASIPSLHAEEQVSDDLIYDQVRRKLASDSQVKGGGLEVEVKQGAVTLRGKVRTEKQKARAEKLTRKVKGVTKVVNELVVEPY